MKLTDLFSKKKHLWSEDLWSGQTDFHSHILFGVDDGVQTLNESVSILERYETWGVTDVWCTPHIMEDIPNKTQDLRIRFDELRAAYKGTIRLHLAAEYMIDSLFIERLSGNDLLPIGDDANKILVETSYYTAPERFMQILEEIKSAGYHPLLAHPERYAYMNKDFYADLKGKNILFQLNIGSLVGVYGVVAQKKSDYLLKNGMYDFFGSDIHHYRMMDNQAVVLEKSLLKVREVVKK